MSYDRRTSDRSVLAATTRRFPQLLGSTVVLVALTILLGVATKAAGAGLACNANWPLCDGGLLNLFPATFPSVFEWIHRVVAMIAGAFIVATAAAAWLGATSDDRVKYAVTAGLALLPVQVLLGRETVLQYELDVLAAHYWTAITIFALFVVAAWLVRADRLSTRHLVAAFAVGAALVPLQVALSPLVVGRYTPPVQTAQYAVTLGLVACVTLVAIAGWRRRSERRELAALLVGAPALTLLTMAFGRRAVVSFAGPTDALYLATAAALCATLLVGAATVRRLDPPADDARPA